MEKKNCNKNYNFKSIRLKKLGLNLSFFWTDLQNVSLIDMTSDYSVFNYLSEYCKNSEIIIFVTT